MIYSFSFETFIVILSKIIVVTSVATLITNITYFFIILLPLFYLYIMAMVRAKFKDSVNTIDL